MRRNDYIQAALLNRKRRPVLQAQRLEALKQTAVDEEPVLIATISSALPQAPADHEGHHPPQASTPAPQDTTPPAPGQAPQSQTQPRQAPGGMMSGPMMQGMMKGMMQTMQGMMGMMQGQMQPGQMQPGQMQPGGMRSGERPPQARDGMMMNPSPGSSGCVAFATGLVPCPLATFMMVYSVANGVLIAGLLITGAMAVGMIATIFLFAGCTILLRGRALRFFERTALARERIGRGLETLSALLIIAFGVWLFAMRAVCQRKAAMNTDFPATRHWD